MSFIARGVSSKLVFRQVCVRGRTRLAVSRYPSGSSAAVRTFTSTRLSRATADEGTFEDIKVKPYVETQGHKASHHGE